MTLINRVRFELRADDVQAALSTAFNSWLARKKVGLTVQPGRQETEGFAVTASSASEDSTRALRYSLEELLPTGTLSTSVIAISTEAETDCWIEDEWVPEEPGAAEPPHGGSADLAAKLAGAIPCYAGAEQLAIQPRLVTVEDSTGLASSLVDAERSVPLVLVSQDRYSTAETTVEKASVLQALLVGSANVVVLTADAGDRLGELVENSLHVAGGSVRLVLPPDSSGVPSPGNLLIPGTVFLRDPSAVGRRLRKSLSHLALSKRLPEVYTEQIVYLEGFPRARNSTDAVALLAQLIDVEADRDRLAEDLDEARLELDFGALQLEESEKLLDSALARVRFLEGRLRAAGDHASAGEATPPAMLPESADTCVESLGLARQYLSYVDVGASDATASSLDTFAKSAAWAKKAWRTFRAMEDYADLKETEGFDGDFLAYCTSAPSGRTTIPPAWVAMKESESTDNNPKYRSARTFAVPEEVNVDGEVYMPAHIKLEAGGRPAPRIHFYDDTSGPSGSVHVGYFGAHLPNSKTN